MLCVASAREHLRDAKPDPTKKNNLCKYVFLVFLYDYDDCNEIIIALSLSKISNMYIYIFLKKTLKDAQNKTMFFAYLSLIFFLCTLLCSALTNAKVDLSGKRLVCLRGHIAHILVCSLLCVVVLAFVVGFGFFSLCNTTMHIIIMYICSCSSARGSRAITRRVRQCSRCGDRPSVLLLLWLTFCFHLVYFYSFSIAFCV